MIRVGVIGACGRMGQMVCRGVAEDPDLTLVAAICRSHAGEPIGPRIGHPELTDVILADELDRLLEAETEVAVDFTTPAAVLDDVRWAVGHSIHAVVGTTGLRAEDLRAIEEQVGQEGTDANVIVVPNFAIGAVLMQRFARTAARFFPAVEVIELHHDGKADAPSGTALATVRGLLEARREAYRGPEGESVAGARGGDVEGVRIHSVRLPGLVAHQEVIFGGPGQILTIRHDSMDRSSFLPGVLLAIKSVSTRRGLTVGLEPLLEGSP
jgi:4-hydroxy-tetrahydrodipicolinate reductase